MDWDWFNIALLVILIIAILEGIYLLLKSLKRRRVGEGEFEISRSENEIVMRMRMQDSIKHGFGFTLGVLIFLLLLFFTLFILQRIGLQIPQPLSSLMF
jgi:hypothetical protein